MLEKKAFSNEKYLKEQSRYILEIVNRFSGKLYLEVGGKLINDLHAARVLPGFDPTVKIKLLQKLKDKIEIILCLYSKEISGRVQRGDLGVSSELYGLKMIDDLKQWGIEVKNVVITRFQNESPAVLFKNKLERTGIKVYLHKFIKGYPGDIEKIASEQGFGKNEYIKTEKPLVVVIAPAANSGKLATCLSQLYHEHKRGVKAGYAKFETFPIWNLPLKHPINIAYEAATVDIGDKNMIDHFHLKAYGKRAVNYNRDIEIFPVLQNILKKITGKNIYKSPTDMGVNRAGFAILNDKIAKEAAKQEIIRRLFRHQAEYIKGTGEEKTVGIVKNLFAELNLEKEDRPVVKPALEAAKTAKGNKGVFSGAALKLKNGKIITGKNSALLHASSALFLNAVKELANIPDEIHLLQPDVLKSLSSFKYSLSGDDNLSLNLEEVLLALAIESASNKQALLALDKIKELKGCEAHLTHIPKPGDENSWRKLGVNLTYESQFATTNLFEQ